MWREREVEWGEREVVWGGGYGGVEELGVLSVSAPLSVTVPVSLCVSASLCVSDSVSAPSVLLLASAPSLPASVLPASVLHALVPVLLRQASERPLERLLLLLLLLPGRPDSLPIKPVRPLAVRLPRQLTVRPLPARLPVMPAKLSRPLPVKLSRPLPARLPVMPLKLSSWPLTVSLEACRPLAARLPVRLPTPLLVRLAAILRLRSDMSCVGDR